MSGSRPADDHYYVDPWSPVVMQGDLFRDVPMTFPWPAEVVALGEESERRFIAGPFETTLAMLVTPTCTMASQGADASAGEYAMASRALVPVRPVQELIDADVVDPARQLGHLRGDRLRNYLYLPADAEREISESVGLLYQPLTLHHDVLDGLRVAQLTGDAYWQLRRSLAFFHAGVRIEADEMGEPPAPRERDS